MTDRLEAARDRLGGLHDHLSRREVALAADDLHAILSAILDHLDAQQVDPQQLAASIRRGLADAAAGRTECLGRFTDYDCTCADNPRCDANHADRVDRYGARWVWCDECDGFRPYLHGMHDAAMGWLAVEIDERYGPLTSAPRPGDTPTAAPQPDEAHGDTPDPARPAERHTARVIKSDYTPTDKFVRDTYAAHRLFNGQPHDTDDTTLGDIRAEFDRWLDGICHEAWGEGYRAGRTDEQDACHCEAWSDDECGCGHYGASTTPNPYRKDRA